MHIPNPVIVPAYQQRVTAFVDILGFTQLIASTEKERSVFEHVFLSLRDVLGTKPNWDDPNVREELWQTNKNEFTKAGRQLSREEHEKMLEMLKSRDQAFAFSDNLVRSSPADWPGVVSVTFSMALLALHLLVRGVFVRGGIAVGSLHHDNSMVFGPALVEAYRLQQELARFPRIVLSPAVAGLMLGDPPYEKDPDIHLKDLILVDLPEGIPYLHFLSKHAVTSAGLVGARGAEVVSTIRRQLIGKLHLYREWPPSIQEKLRWFVRYFNGTVDSGTALPGTSKIDDLPWKEDEVPILRQVPWIQVYRHGMGIELDRVQSSSTTPPNDEPKEP
jgi:hypothetical protein